jgi:hypothetical protein
MMEILHYGILILLFLIITGTFGFIRLKLFSSFKDNKTIIKIIISIDIILIIIFIVYNMLPKRNVGIDISINNKNTFSEININGINYNMRRNERSKNINVNDGSGFIAIKTKEKAKIVFYFNEKTIFPFNKSVRIKITSKNIKINSIFLKTSIYTDDYEKYDDILNLLINKR